MDEHVELALDNRCWAKGVGWLIVTVWLDSATIGCKGPWI